MEEFKTIEGFENYEISNLGNVRNKKTNRILKPGIDSHEYYNVNLCENGKKTTKHLHRLIAFAFIENTENKPFIDHIDNNKLNNNIENLRWATNQENQRNSKLSAKNTSGIKGVCFYKKLNKWSARIKIDGINIHLGLYENIEDAKQARINKVNEVFGVYKNACEN